MKLIALIAILKYFLGYLIFFRERFYLDDYAVYVFLVVLIHMVRLTRFLKSGSSRLILAAFHANH